MDPYPRSPARAGIRITVDDRRWRRLVPRVETLATRAAAAAGGEASVVLTDDRTVRRMNARHRGQDKATNVLSFDPPGAGLPGELVLALGVMRREARAAGIRLGDHLAHLVVHGALHLRGHDHHRAGEARLMEMTEARLLAKLGVGNPWRPR
jgi:probable rRNA maturation factor